MTIHRVAAIDCGTNSIRLQVAGINSKADGIERTVGSTDESAPPTDVARQMRIVPLGEGVDRPGRLSEAALDRTMTVLPDTTANIDAALDQAAASVPVGKASTQVGLAAAIPAMHPGRVDVIGAGALILDRIMTRFGFAEALVSEHDILDGIATSLVP